MNALLKADFAKSLKRVKPRAATERDVVRCHDKQYVQTAKRDIRSGAHVLSTGDTHICRDSLTVALHAAGGACAAVDAVMQGKAKNVFCAVRPPGHHATPNRGMGFCIFNNAAIAARYAQQQHKIGKVLIVDWDVHHGNGTQDIFYEDGSARRRSVARTLSAYTRSPLSTVTSPASKARSSTRTARRASAVGRA